MALTPYSKTVWINGSTPAINSTNLNKIENQLQATTSETIVIQTSLLNINKGLNIYATSNNGNDSYVITTNTVFTAYNSGLHINIKVDVGNTGSATINVDSLGAKTIKKMAITGLVDVATGDMIAGGIYSLIYDGTYFILSNPLSIDASLITNTGDIIYASAANTPSRLAVGSAGKVLGVANGGTVPSYLIQEFIPLTQSTLSTTPTQVDFDVSSYSYDIYKIVMKGGFSSQEDLWLRFNDNTGNNYYWGMFKLYQASPYYAFSGSSNTATSKITHELDGGINYSSYTSIIISKFKDSNDKLNVQSVIETVQGNRVVSWGSYYPNTTANLTKINLIRSSSATFKSGTKFELYGGNI